MNASEFSKIIGLITGAFPHMDRFKDNDVKEVWFECLEDLEYERARKATLNAIKAAKDYPPDIATIREEYDKLYSEERKSEGEIRRFYDQARSYYPGSGEYGYGWEEFRARVKDAREAEQLQNIIIGYVRHLEKIGAKEVMDFAECVRTVRRENGEIVAGDK
jgi:hypothetical protein